MSDDIKTILERLTLIESSVTSQALPKHGLNKQQKSVNQLPALFKPKKIDVLNNKKPYPKHPASGYFVGGEAKEPYCDACDRVESQCICDTPVAEDMIGKVRKDLNDYLMSLEKEMRPDHALIAKAKDAIMNPEIDKLLPIKSLHTHDGKEMRIHGNENDGFIIRINERPLRARFMSLDEAELACEMFCNRRLAAEQVVQSQDYVEEQ